jgi:hypothetical protein
MQRRHRPKEKKELNISGKSGRRITGLFYVTLRKKEVHSLRVSFHERDNFSYTNSPTIIITHVGVCLRSAPHDIMGVGFK